MLGRLKPYAGYLIALGGLAWILHDVHPREIFANLTMRDWRWASAAIFIDILTYLTQGWRWKLLLKPVGNLAALRATQAIYAGLFTSEVLPLRVGELVRAYLASRWLSVRFGTVIPSMAVERVLDGIWLALGIGAAAVFAPLPPRLMEAADIFGAAVLVCTALFIYLAYRYRYGRPLDTRSATGIKSFIAIVASGFREIAVSRQLWFAIPISLLMLGLQCLAFWMVMLGYGFNFSFWIGATVFLVVHLGTAIPNAPANLGSYQFFTVVGLTLFGVDKAVATGFSIVVFLVMTIPLWLIGFFALARTGMSLASVRAELGRAR